MVDGGLRGQGHLEVAVRAASEHISGSGRCGGRAYFVLPIRYQAVFYFFFLIFFNFFFFFLFIFSFSHTHTLSLARYLSLSLSLSFSVYVIFSLALFTVCLFFFFCFTPFYSCVCRFALATHDVVEDAPLRSFPFVLFFPFFFLGGFFFSFCDRTRTCPLHARRDDLSASPARNESETCTGESVSYTRDEREAFERFRGSIASK